MADDEDVVVAACTTIITANNNCQFRSGLQVETKWKRPYTCRKYAFDKSTLAALSIGQFCVSIESPKRITFDAYKRPDVCDVLTSNNDPATGAAITSWEQKHSCVLPEDLKNFYLSMNGFSLRWHVRVNADTTIPVGRIEINSVGKLNKLTFGSLGSGKDNVTIADLHLDSDDEAESPEMPAKPMFDHRCRAFELEPSDGYCKVCLVFRNTKLGVVAHVSEIWLLDRSLKWHYMSADFMQYYCQMMIHVGLPQWQLAFTDFGLLPQAKQWFNLYCPTRLEDGDTDDSAYDIFSGSTSTQLDVAKVFKGKTDKKKVIGSQIVKKKPSVLASPIKPGSGKASTSSIQLNKPINSKP